MQAHEIRQRFTDFFTRNGHKKVPSSSLIPHNDPTLLFANAGMNQFKDYFTGKSTPDIPRAVTIQKCVRAGGKHNDLDNVGFTARHHTFFEMLGNFSFGDYFKEDAIKFAWDFLTKELGLSEDRLYATIHTSDDEAYKIWNQTIGLGDERIFRKGDEENFWEMGEFGPCGPCSEIFYDHGPSYATPNFEPGEGQDILDDEMRYVEIWNLVFMQYERTPEGQHNLPKPSIDTGAGLERLCAVLQEKYWNYDTDLFVPIFKKIEGLTGKKYQDKTYQSSMRVIADHIRSCTMLITDGVIPSNEGRGYVLRRIIRRAVRHLRELDAPAGSFAQLIPAVFEKLGDEYPQNKKNIATAEKFLELEEKKFLETLDHGLKYLNDAIKKNLQGDTLPGESAFMLYDTYGFPLDLTEILLQEKGFKVDREGFDRSMQRRKEESKKSWKGAQAVDDRVFYESKERHGETKFLGYDTLESEAKLLEILELNEEQVGLIFNKTPFYGESGGQVGDTGVIYKNGEKIAQIIDTQKPVDQFHVHFVSKAPAEKLKVGEHYQLTVQSKERKLTARNHSATHLLQSALINVLGTHVKQAGSLVNAKRLRFDFTHMKALSPEEIQQVEDLVNQQIQKGLDVTSEITSMDRALEKGALALFGEKYGESVRLLEMGDFSTELCGGTHVQNTSEIGLFKITSESSLSSGVRRIEAVTSETAINMLNERSKILSEMEKLTKVKGEKVLERFQAQQQEIKTLKKEVQSLKEKLQSIEAKNLFSSPETLSQDISFVATQAPKGADLKKISDDFANKFSKGILLLYSPKGDKMKVLVRSTGLNQQLNCSEILNAGLSLIDGRGGGRPDMAQGSGNSADMGPVVKKIKEEIQANLT